VALPSSSRLSLGAVGRGVPALTAGVRPCAPDAGTVDSRRSAVSLRARDGRKKKGREKKRERREGDADRWAPAPPVGLSGSAPVPFRFPARKTYSRRNTPSA